MNRHDWWNLYLEHSPIEWAAQVAAAQVIPLADERDDLRAAVNTLLAICSQSAKTVSEETIQHLAIRLTTYMHPKSDKPLSPADTKRMLGGG